MAKKWVAKAASDEFKAKAAEAINKTDNEQPIKIRSAKEVRTSLYGKDI